MEEHLPSIKIGKLSAELPVRPSQIKPDGRGFYPFHHWWPTSVQLPIMQVMNVIFFDGHCGLCNGFVDFMMKADPQGKFKFSPLQGEYAKAHLNPKDIQELTSVVVLINGKSYRKAPGVIMALSELGGVWKTASALKVLPTGILNFGYDLVAKNRYRLFGKRETCRLPTPEERSRFL